MRNTILTILVFLLTFSASIGQVEKDNLKFHKKGIYQYKGKHEGTFIKRTKRKQIEYNKDKTKVLVLKIKWVSDDEYWLTFVKEKNSPGCLKKGYVIKSKIIHANENEYSCVWECKQCGKGEVTFVKVEPKKHKSRPR